ncbi:protein BFR2 [Diplocarpon rosae]|nr:protein BFR2 [Diplocarpon rosae]
MGKSKSFAQHIAELIEPVARDFDPEEDAPAQSTDGSASEESEDEKAGTEHYVKVGKSTLRKPDEVALGPEYSGSRVSREALWNDDDDEEEENNSDSASEADDAADVRVADPEDSDLDMDMDVDEDEDIDSDFAFGQSDDEKFKDFAFRGSGKPRRPSGKRIRPTASDFMSESEDEDDEEDAVLNGDNSDEAETDEDILDVSKQHQDDDSGSDARSDEDVTAEENDDSESSEDAESGAEEDEEERRAELRKIMGEEQQGVVASITQAAKADAAKGSAVKEQRKAFDSFLSVRMVLQKALIATNSMTTIEEKEFDEESNHPYEAAEEAAVKLWNTLDALRHELSKAGSGAKIGHKRKRDIEVSTPSTDIWERMQSSEVAIIDTRQTTLEKWSSKVRGTTSIPISRKLNPTAPQQFITSMLQDHLANSDHLIQKTKIPRACAPIQRDEKLTEDPDIYDDGNFYQMLLKELVDQRRAESLTAPAAGKALQWTAVKEVKTRKNVDTKASKGRKMRFTVLEKLQNFMAPEDRTTWRPEAVDSFFGNLLGQKTNLAEDEEDAQIEQEVNPLEALVFGS